MIYAELVVIYVELIAILQDRFHIEARTSLPTTQFSSGTHGTLPLPSRCRSDCLHKVEMGLGVGELLEVLDLQTPVFVGNDVFDED